ncbi:unnamed protein product [Adineta steineri]|uniref:RBR-type E3 ubiquitin transferase n=1 Tax=Adineta steineri TaxID=433720 RepID=A0A818SYR0_9BILA|nr:unnamed protein product [Adineta steineri]
MSDDETDGDEECFYELAEMSSKLNHKLSTSDDEFDENFYEIDDDISNKTPQAYIDEPITPGDEINPNFHYSILTQDQYIELMMKYVDEVKDILQLPSSIIKLLLHYFKWNNQRLLEQFYEMNNEEFFQQAKIINPFSLKISPEELTNLCSICCSDDEKDMFHLECNHTFCNDCWKTYITNQILHEGHSQTIVCPYSECDILVDDETILKFLNDNEFAKNMYTKMILNSYVDNNPRVRWCPGKDCNHIINATSLTSSYNYAQLITCNNCQTIFCFQCTQPWHDPIKCILLIEWNKKLIGDTLNVLWLKTNTQACPKCKVHIEKNGGCNHMSCKHCQYEFCWLCFNDWSKHRECNRFVENNINITDAANTLGLSRYIHHLDRYRNHENSLKLETKLFKKTHRKLLKNKDKLSKNDIQTIEKAFEILLKCRQILTYTYPFAYYLTKNNQSDVFEQNQADLEQACEHLSEFLEKDITSETIFNDIKRKIVEQYQYCDARQSVLLKHVKEGYTNDYWQYQDEIKTNINNKI